MAKLRFVDLTHTLYPGKEEYKLELRTFQVDELFPQYYRKKGDWYIMQEVHFLNHVGTHIESPLHHLKDGTDCSELPMNRLVAPAVILDFTHKIPDETIKLDEVKSKAGNIHAGDAVIFHTGRWQYYRDIDESHLRPYPTPEALEWLCNRGIVAVGIDCTGIEVKGAKEQPNHKILFKHGIPLIENIANLNALQSQRVLLVALPLKISGLETSPIRLIAIEGVDL